MIFWPWATQVGRVTDLKAEASPWRFQSKRHGAKNCCENLRVFWFLSTIFSNLGSARVPSTGWIGGLRDLGSRASTHWPRKGIWHQSGGMQSDVYSCTQVLSKRGRHANLTWTGAASSHPSLEYLDFRQCFPDVLWLWESMTWNLATNAFEIVERMVFSWCPCVKWLAWEKIVYLTLVRFQAVWGNSL